MRYLLTFCILLFSGYVMAAGLPEDFPYAKRIQRNFDREKYARVLEDLKKIESTGIKASYKKTITSSSGSKPRLKYHHHVLFYHYKLSSLIYLNRVEKPDEAIRLYNQLCRLDSRDEYRNLGQYQQFKKTLSQLAEAALARNHKGVARKYVDALASWGDTTAFYRRVHPTAEDLKIAAELAWREAVKKLKVLKKPAVHSFLKSCDFREIDQKARSCKKEKNLQAQVCALTTGLEYDFQKARAIYIWIVYNIDYDYTFSIYDGETTYRKGKGVCSGFSYLFKQMCALAGLKTYRVTGLADGARGWELHAWNLVELQGHPFLIESTWASCRKQNPEYIEKYFLAEEQWLAKTHQWNEVN